jgi:hypothetical protein
MSRDQKRQRGSIALELALSISLFITIMLGAFQMSRHLMTKQRLSDATAFGLHSSIISGQHEPDFVRNAVLQRLGTEALRCTQVEVETNVVPGAYLNGWALEVTTICTVAPLFPNTPFATMEPASLVAIAAWPI